MLTFVLIATLGAFKFIFPTVLSIIVLVLSCLIVNSLFVPAINLPLYEPTFMSLVVTKAPDIRAP